MWANLNSFKPFFFIFTAVARDQKNKDKENPPNYAVLKQAGCQFVKQAKYLILKDVRCMVLKPARCLTSKQVGSKLQLSPRL